PFFFYYSGNHRYLHSFPTRRSSDLTTGSGCIRACSTSVRCTLSPRTCLLFRCPRNPGQLSLPLLMRPLCHTLKPRWLSSARLERSEEHKSELQSRSEIVSRLLLEKN